MKELSSVLHSVPQDKRIDAFGLLQQGVQRLPAEVKGVVVEQQAITLQILPEATMQGAFAEVLRAAHDLPAPDQVAEVLKHLSFASALLPLHHKQAAFDTVQQAVERLPVELQRVVLQQQADTLCDMPHEGAQRAFAAVLRAAQALPATAYPTAEDRVALGQSLARSFQNHVVGEDHPGPPAGADEVLRAGSACLNTP